MTRTQRSNVSRNVARGRAAIRNGVRLALLATLPAAYAQQASETTAPATSATGLEEVVVTAQKRTENLQDVPVSIQTLNSEKLEQLNITDIDDYVRNLSGVTTVKGLGQGGTGIGTTHVYMRGVVSGQDGNHSASQPTVGTYLDEQPITTIDGTPDIHIYDIARIEVLEGPQGTLYGASSEAGTIRIITNKPDPTKFSAGYDISGNSVDHGGLGWTAEGFVNIPLSPIAALRLVGWDEHDAGYIHDIAGTNATAGILDGVRTFPTSGTSISNVNTQNSEYNTAENRGGRAQARVELGDWSITPSFIGQEIDSRGFFAYDPAVGDLDAVRFGPPEGDQDSFTQTSLTIEGKVSNFDITYSGGWFVRNTHTLSDYSDYSYFYDKYFGSGCNWVTESGYHYLQANPAAHCAGTYPAGSYAEPQEYVITNGHYTKWSNELRISSPQDYPVKGIVGVFAQRQVHEIWEQYTIPGANGNPYNSNPQGFAQSLSIPGVAGNTIWLTDEERVDRDSAAFTQLSWDVTSQFQLLGGIRFYKYENSLQGFYGYSAAYQDLSGFYPGQNICTTSTPFHGAPCQDLDQTVSDRGRTYRATATYKFTPEKLVYFTYSTGYRPGGVNRVFDAALNSVFPPYKSDVLTNWEVGFKTEWLDKKLRWNGALFLENWDNFQFLFLGPNSVTVVQNAASAQIKGFETDLQFNPVQGLLLSTSATYLHAVTTANYCGPNGTNGASNYIPGTTELITNCPNQINSYADGLPAPVGPEAPSGTKLPVAPTFKISAVARYSFPITDTVQGFGQVSGMYQTSTTPLLRLIDSQSLGTMPAYALVDLSTGINWNSMFAEFDIMNVADKRAQLTRFVECATTTCGPQPYIIPTQPRTLMLKFGQRF
jgi:iron complex outermembrane recepter protein